MSHIPNKKPQMSPGFGALNHRKTVGQTYGERREKVVENTTEKGIWQTIKDRFSGGKKPNNIGNFANKADRYEGVKKNHYMTHVQNGTAHQKGVQSLPKDKYITSLDTLISLLDGNKAPKKREV